MTQNRLCRARPGLRRVLAMVVVAILPLSAWAQDRSDDHTFRVAFEFGPINVRTLDFQAPPGSGTFISLQEGDELFTMTAQMDFAWRFRPRHEIVFYLAPLELRDFETVPEQDVDFGGVTFPAGVTTISRYLFYEYALRYRYRLVRNDRIDVRLGATMSITDTVGTVLQESTDLFAEVGEVQVLPLVHGAVEVFLTPQVSVLAQADWIRLTDSRYSNVFLAGRWHPRPRWDFSFGYRGMSRTVEASALNNKFALDNFVFTVGYRFGGSSS